MYASKRIGLLPLLKEQKRYVSFNVKQKSNSSDAFTLNGVLMLSIPVVTFCLGTWQVKRRRWKLELVSELERKTNLAPLNLTENIESVAELEYQKVSFSGKFDHSKEMFLGPRPLLTKGDVPSGGGLISTGKSGFNVITPFTLSEENITILVNRGWVPKNKKNASTRLEGQVEEEINLTGVVRPHENRPPFMPDNKTDDLYLYRNVNEMCKVAQTSAIYVDAIESTPGGPIGSQTRVTLWNEHLSYIFTWYSLSLATSFLWFQKFIKGKSLM